MLAESIHIDSIPAPLLNRAGQALFRTLRDSTRTNEIVVAEEILAQGQFEYWVVSGLFDSDEARDLLADYTTTYTDAGFDFGAKTAVRARAGGRSPARRPRPQRLAMGRRR